MPASPTPAVPSVRFVPARWVLATVTLLRLAMRGRAIGSAGVVGLAWTLAPRKLKLAAAGVAAYAALLLAGAVAALALLLMQLS